MNIQVTSVSRKEQSLSKVGAAVFVVTQADTWRSRALNIPDLLRLPPGVDVARIDANQWAISMRGRRIINFSCGRCWTFRTIWSETTRLDM
jgi:iron complex outermembrane recepter protein